MKRILTVVMLLLALGAFPAQAQSIYQRIRCTDAEMEELRWVIALEAQGEGYDGEIAVCESIYNRVLSPNWPNTIHGVLSQKRQYATYKYIGSEKAWATPGELEDDVISSVLRTGPAILPDTSYVYFDSCGGANGRKHWKLGKHTFGAERRK